VWRDVQGQSEFVINPLFSWFHDERTGESSVSVLKYLFRHDTENGVSTTRLFYIPVWSG